MIPDYTDMRGKILVVGHYAVIGEDNGSTLYIGVIRKITPKLVQVQSTSNDRMFQRRHDRVVSLGE